MHRKLLSVLTKRFSSIKSRYSEPSAQSAFSPAPHVRSCQPLCLLRSFLLSFPDQLGWRRLMNYADEILITGLGHHQPPGSAGPRGQKKKMLRKWCFISHSFTNFYIILVTGSISPMNETLNWLYHSTKAFADKSMSPPTPGLWLTSVNICF